jgi:hypothetical protein
MNGRLVFTLEEIDQWRVQEPETPLILVAAIPCRTTFAKFSPPTAC